MPGVGLEPTRAEARGILSPLRLPVPPSRPTTNSNTCLRDLPRTRQRDPRSDLRSTDLRRARLPSGLPCIVPALTACSSDLPLAAHPKEQAQ